MKRAIDRFNQQRNDATERIDDFLKREIEDREVIVAPDARWNSETPGSVIDRLSILALRIYHMQEQVERADAGPITSNDRGKSSRCSKSSSKISQWRCRNCWLTSSPAASD